MSIVTFNGYQRFCESTWVAHQNEAYEIIHAVLGLSGEAGEITEKFKKQIRGDGAVPREAVAKELGDVLYYVATLARLYGFTLEDIATMNIAKLQDRVKRNVLKGSGDDR